MALPTNLFDESWYLARNPDVAAAIEAGLISSALDHFNLYGKFENRAAGPLFNPSDYLAANPDVAEAVQAGLISAYDHFMQYGASESRSPLSLFDPEFYLAQNPDVAAAVEAGLITATEHFLLYGQGEPRQINPFINLGDYMNANADIAEAAANGAISPLTHLLTHGAAEGRDLGNGINLGIFANDPKFQEAVQSSNLQAALERVEEVAPFLPTFEPPAGWEPPADTPIPTDFTPPEGTKLVIPPSVNVPDDVELPDDIFEPVEPGPGPEPQPEPEPEPEPEFKAALDAKDRVITFTSKNVSGPIYVTESDGALTFARGKASDSSPIEMPEDRPALTLDLGAVNHVQAKGDYSTQAPDTSGAPRLWLDYGSATKAYLTVNEVAAGSAFGIIGATVEEIIVSGSVAEDWGQLQIWDKGAEHAALQKLVLNMKSNTDLGAYAPHGILTQPNAFDGSGSTGGLKIGLTHESIHGKVNWRGIATGDGNDEIRLDMKAFSYEDGTVLIDLNDGEDTLEIVGKSVLEVHIDAGEGDDDITFNPENNGIMVSGGDGNDDFIVVTDADPSNARTTFAFITDYEEGDILDLTGVEYASLGFHTNIYNSHSDWVGVAAEKAGVKVEEGATVIKLINSAAGTPGSASPLLVLNETYKEGTTIEIKMTGEQIPGSPWGNGEVVTILASISEGAEISAAGRDEGVLLLGGGGNQTLISGFGNDVMRGGGGDDVFVFEASFGKDTIVDFERGSDKIHLTMPGLTSDDVSLSVDNGNTVVTINGDSSNAITVLGVTGLDESDFILSASI